MNYECGDSVGFFKLRTLHPISSEILMYLRDTHLHPEYDGGFPQAVRFFLSLDRSLSVAEQNADAVRTILDKLFAAHRYSRVRSATRLICVSRVRCRFYQRSRESDLGQ